MGTSQMADHGIACFLLNEHAHILLDRQLMTLGEQHPDSLPFDPASRNFHQVVQHVWHKAGPVYLLIVESDGLVDARVADVSSNNA